MEQVNETELEVLIKSKSKPNTRVDESLTGQIQPKNQEVQKEVIKNSIDNSKYKFLAKEIVKIHEERSAMAFLILAYRNPKRVKSVPPEKYMEIIKTIQGADDGIQAINWVFKPERVEVDETF